MNSLTLIRQEVQHGLQKKGQVPHGQRGISHPAGGVDQLMQQAHLDSSPASVSAYGKGHKAGTQVMCEMWQLTDNNLNDQTQMAKTITTTIPYPGVGLPENNIVRSLRMSLPGNRAVGCFFYSFALCSFEGPDTQLPNNSLTE